MDWKNSLSFSDRLANIINITTAYKSAHPDIDSTEASKHARLLETQLFNDAQSNIDYQLACQTSIQDFAIATKHEPEQLLQSSEVIAQEVLSNAVKTAKFGRYKEAAYFRDGLFSEVFVAKIPQESNPPDLEDRVGHYVALKATHLSSMVAPHNSEREIRIIKRVAGPHIMPLLESFYDGAGHLVLVSPFMPLTLEQLLHDSRNNDTIDPTIKSSLKDIFEALAHIHSQDIIHRDIKPSNILLQSPTGPAYLSDFGIAWSPTDPASEKPNDKISDVGTTCYRAPEVLFGDRAYDCSLDMWAAGCVVAEALLKTGKSLFDPGEAGTELTLILSIFQSIGTPTLAEWPEINRIPDWGKMNFMVYPAKSWDQLLPNTSSSGRDLVQSLVKYSGSQRLTAQQVLDHAFFSA